MRLSPRSSLLSEMVLICYNELAGKIVVKEWVLTAAIVDGAFKEWRETKDEGRARREGKGTLVLPKPEIEDQKFCHEAPKIHRA